MKEYVFRSQNTALNVSGIGIEMGFKQGFKCRRFYIRKITI